MTFLYNIDSVTKIGFDTFRTVNKRSDGSIYSILYSRNGKNHRTDGEALARYDNDGRVMSHEWYENGKLHRVYGPAVIQFHANGTVTEQWYIDGKNVTSYVCSILEQMGIPFIYSEWSDDDKFIFKISFSYQAQ